jgi:DNA polymerase elongation subunit (family B)
VRFNEKSVFYYAQNMLGIMLQHTRNLVASRKIAQGVQGSYEYRVDQERTLLKGWLKSQNDKLEDLVDEATKYIEGKDIRQDDQSLWHLNIQRLEYERKQLYETFKEINRAAPSEDMNVLIDMAREYTTNPKSNPIKKEVLRYALLVIQDLVERIQALKAKIGSDVEPNMKLKSMAVIVDLLHQISEYESEVANYNAKQNELKVGSNSTFGFLGAGKIRFKKNGQLRRTGMQTAKPVSACVTYLGRQAIERAKQMAEEKVPGSKVIYIDTDSIFWDAKLPNTEEGFIRTFTLAAELAEEITADAQARNPGTMKIVHEKTARVIALYTAKCYALYKFLAVDKPGKVEIKGLSFSKRDACKFTSKLGKTLLDMLLMDRNIEAAKQYVKDEAMKLVMKDFAREAELEQVINKRQKVSRALSRARQAEDGPAISQLEDMLKAVDIEVRKLKEDIKAGYEEVALYKKLGKKSYDGKCVGHAKLAERIDQRNPGLGPKTGESVKFLYWYKDARDFKANKKMEDKIEDFDYAIDKKLKVDILWYLENQITKTVTKVFSIIMKNPKDLLNDAIGLQQNKQMGAKMTVDKADFSGLFDSESEDEMIMT